MLNYLTSINNIVYAALVPFMGPKNLKVGEIHLEIAYSTDEINLTIEWRRLSLKKLKSLVLSSRNDTLKNMLIKLCLLISLTAK